MKIHDVKIITIGYGYSDVLASNPNFLNHYNFNGLNILKLFKNIKKINMEFKPDIYHFFDDVTYNILRFYIGSNKHKVILSKCGGPNIEWPYVNNLILFHRENNDFYKNIPKFKDVHIHLIPNRVQKLEINDLFQPIPKDTDSFNFVRICRIGISYKKSIEDSINLVFYLHKKDSLKQSYTLLVLLKINLFITSLSKKLRITRE